MIEVKNITKDKITKALSKHSEISKIDSKKFVDSFFRITKVKLNSRIVKIKSFGTFQIKKTKKRIGRNPKTLEEFEIPVRKKVIFKTSSILKKRIN